MRTRKRQGDGLFGKTEATPEPSLGDKRGKTVKQTLVPALTALGIVFGDIGTSPIYAFRAALNATGSGGGAVGATEILGILSLIFWSLTIVVSLKYVILVMQADNRGEGGILALASLLNPWGRTAARRSSVVLVALAGGAFLVGDAVVTPAISVLSAVEGATLVAPSTADAVVPVTVVILIAMFSIQSRGTKRIGAWFGPVMALWFTVLAGLGLVWIARRPEVLWALNPAWAGAYLFEHANIGIAVFGAVFLVVTGGEALYADMGHIGRPPIRQAWFILVMPALLLNYFGQGAAVLSTPAMAENPFFLLAPTAALAPLVALATLATIIASQATITGAFTLAKQAAQLRLWPPAHVKQTSAGEYGQVYVKTVNWILAGLTVLLVLSFGSSDALAAAYGVSVSGAMLATIFLLPIVAVEKWGWPASVALMVCGPLAVIDSAFLFANLLKIVHGGWVPLAVGLLVLAIALIWEAGHARLRERLAAMAEPAVTVERMITESGVVRVSGTVVAMSTVGKDGGVPPMLVHHIHHNRSLHEHVLIFHAQIEEIPRVSALDRLEFGMDEAGFYRVTAHYGFMQTPDVPVAIRLCQEMGLPLVPEEVTYFVGHETLVVLQGEPAWKSVFAFLIRNAGRASTFFHLPANQVVEIGLFVEI
ncbi:putative potassium transport system protein Kup 1 [uncultured Gammaproteobacteria bacterium]